MGKLIVSALAGVGKALLTEKIIINLVLVLAEWLVKRTGNDLDDKILAVVKEALDKRQGKSVGNLYDAIKAAR